MRTFKLPAANLRVKRRVRYKVIVFDIDGTIAKHVSSWRYIHEKLGLWDELACRYQDKFLAGKISYRKFCELDAAHWKDLPEKRIKEIFASAQYTKNAVRHIRRLKKMGFKMVAVSTGLQYMAERVKKELKFDYVLSNRLISKRGFITGKVKINIAHGAKGDIVKKILRKFCVTQNEIISVGDNAGDIPLAKHSGYSIAFNSSDKVFSGMVDYDCRTKDFKEVFKKIVSVSKA